MNVLPGRFRLASGNFDHLKENDDQADRRDTGTGISGNYIPTGGGSPLFIMLLLKHYWIFTGNVNGIETANDDA